MPRRKRAILLSLFTFLTLATESGATAAEPQIVRVLLPTPGRHAEAFERELTALVNEYNRRGPETGRSQVQLLRRGEDFSSLRDLTTSLSAGAPPEIAAIECGEIEALGRRGRLPPIPSERAERFFEGIPDAYLRQVRDPSTGAYVALPFARAFPVLVADMEAIAKAGIRLKRLPSTWSDLQKLESRLSVGTSAGDASGNGALLLPLEGPRALWILEAMTGTPLWKREAGGLRTNRDLLPLLNELRKTLARQQPMSWDRAIGIFLERKRPLLVTTSDALPMIAAQAKFPWEAAFLPRLRGRESASAMMAGFDWVVPRGTSAAWDFLEYLYQPSSVTRWAPAGGFLPLKRDWTSKAASPVSGLWRLSIFRAHPGKHASPMLRTTDAEMVRARSLWIQALPDLIGPASHHEATEAVLSRLDQQLNSIR